MNYTEAAVHFRRSLTPGIETRNTVLNGHDIDAMRALLRKVEALEAALTRVEVATGKVLDVQPICTVGKGLAGQRLPDAIAIDAQGYWWRTWDDLDYWSMVPVNPDNSPIPRPVKWYRLVEFNPEETSS